VIGFQETDDFRIAPLHVRSGYSLLRGTMALPRLVESAARAGHRRIALTDVNGLYGAPAFWKLARDAGLEPLIGAELLEGRQSILALIENDAGYENLCRIITQIANCELPAADCQLPPADGGLTEIVAQRAEGLHFVVEDGSLAACLLAAGIGRDRLWLGLDPGVQRASMIRELTEASARLHLPLVATGKALLAEGDEDAARLLGAIRTGTLCDSVPAGELPPFQAVMRTGRRLAGRLAEFPDAVANNRRLAESCAAFQLLPRRPVFPAFPCPDGQSPHGFLRHLCREGLIRRYGPIPSEAARRRLDKELDLIERMGFCEYFLVVWDIVQYARRRGAPVAGRGSGASSLAAYVLGITNVCPLAYDIPFERFLHENREDFPDLDVDFCWRIRDDVIDYVFGRWGGDRVAMVCTHNTFQPASALRETAKAMGLSNEQISGLSQEDFDLKSEITNPKSETKSEIRNLKSQISNLKSETKSEITNPKSEISNHKSQIRNPESEIAVGRIAELARRIMGLPHNLSVHPGGIVIGRKPIDHYVPVQPAAKGVTITQYDKNGVEDIRLVKLDLLGNRNLSTIRAACDLIARRGGAIDIESLPPEDPATIEMLRVSDTVGCNQLESPAMRHLLRMMQPKDTRDVMKALALIRPGAASIGMKEVFIRRHRGLDAVPTGFGPVDELLRQTCGVMLYEDDVMLVAAALTGSTLPEADRFRKAVQKCPDDRRRLELSREFLARCVAHGADLDYAKALWVQMAKYNAYSFCRAHAASYAILAYAGAYLKAHRPLEFWTAALNNNQGMWHPRVYVEQAKRAGIRFLLPDVNRSGAEFSVEEDPNGAPAIRVGLNLVGGLGPVGVQGILEERKRGEFQGLSDFLYRIRPAEEQVRSLILCGAFDCFGRTRPTLMMELNLCLKVRPVRPPGKGRQEGPDGAFASSRLLPAWPTIPNMPGDYDEARKYADQRGILGISVGEHVMARHRQALQAQGLDADCRELPHLVGRSVRIAGVQEARRTTHTEKGQTMMFLTLEDEFGLFEVTLFPDVYRRCGSSFTHYGPYVVTGKVEQQYGALTVSADRVVLRSAGAPPGTQELISN